MGTFDEAIDSIIRAISTAQHTKQQEAKSLSMTAENMFGAVGSLIEELQPQLVAKFPDQKPSVSLSGWVKTENGATNTLKLKSATVEKDIELRMVIGQTDVTVNGKLTPSRYSSSAVATEIVKFFSEQ